MNNNYLEFTSNEKLTWWGDCALLCLILGILFLSFLGSTPLFVPDEGRYAEIAREMVLSNDFITPHLNGIKYFEKPPFFYWLESFSINSFGLNLWAIRSINALLGLLGCLSLYGVGRVFYNRKVGFLAAFILGTSLLYLMMSRMITLDLPVTFFMSLGLYSLLIAILKHQKIFFYVATIFFSIATLTKGLIGIFFPVLIMTIWFVSTQSLKQLKTYPWYLCMIIFLIITLPWHIIVSLKNPEFAYFYFIEQHFLRYLNPEIGHYQPNWFFIPVLLISFFPWILLLPNSLITSFKKRKEKKVIDLFFWIWISVVFIFFSFSKSKLIPYILPMFPPLALMAAKTLAEIHYIKQSKTIILSTLSLFIFLIFMLIGMNHLSHQRSIIHLAEMINTLKKGDEEVISYHRYYQDLPFYLKQRVSILGWKNELDFGAKHQSTVNWLIEDPEFWDRFNHPKRVFVIIGEDEFKPLKESYVHDNIHVLAKSLNTLLISNQPSG